MMLRTEAIIIDHILNGIDIVIGMDVINKPGGLAVKKNDAVKFGEIHYVAAAQEPNWCRINNKDFKAEFDSKKWTVEWH